MAENNSMIKLLVTFIFPLLFSSTLLGSEVKYDIAMGLDGEKVYLYSDQCDFLQEAQTGLGQFYYGATNEPQPKLPCTCGLEELDRKCKVDITPVLSEKISGKLGRIPHADGPNCFNAALVAVGILPYFHHTNNFDFWLLSPLCEEVQKKERRPGDIVTLTDRDYSYHAFVYINDLISFQKQGYASINPHRIDSTESIFDTYEMKPGCRWSDSQKCEHRETKVFRCESWDEYSDKIKKNKEQIEFEKQIESISCVVSEAAYSDRGLSVEVLSDILRVLRVMAKQEARNSLERIENKAAEQVIEIGDDLIADYIFWEGMLNQVDDVLEQLNMLPH